MKGVSMPNTSPDKPFFNYADQIEALRKKNILVPEENVENIKKLLSIVSYFTLVNGYSNSNLVTNKKFNNISIDLLLELYFFDLDLQSILFKYITIIETALKTKISYIVGENFGEYTPCENPSDSPDLSSSYLNRTHYTGSDKARILQKLRDHIKYAFDDPLKIYKEGDPQNNILPKNHIPPWVLVKNIYFKDAINWYTILPRINNKDLKLEIIHDFLNNTTLIDEDLKSFFIISLKIINQFRNSIAHGNKSINIKLKRQLDARILNSLISDSYIFDTNTDYNKYMLEGLFPVLLSIIFLLPTINLKKEFVSRIHDLFRCTQEKDENLYSIIFSVSNLPENFIERLEKLVLSIR